MSKSSLGWTVGAGSDRVEEIFEMAEPGKDFEVYSRSRLVRAQMHDRRCVRWSDRCRATRSAPVP